MARHNRPNGFFVVGEAHSFIALVDFLKRRPQNFSIKTRYVHTRDRLLLVDIDYRVTVQRWASIIVYRLLLPMDLVDTFRIHIGSWQLVVSGYDQQTMLDESAINLQW